MNMDLRANGPGNLLNSCVAFCLKKGPVLCDFKPQDDLNEEMISWYPARNLKAFRLSQ